MFVLIASGTEILMVGSFEVQPFFGNIAFPLSWVLTYGFFPRVCAGFGTIPWYRDTCEILLPHSRTNESRAHMYIPFPHKKVPRKK